MVDAEEFRQLRSRVEELEHLVDYHRQCHSAGSDAVIALAEKVADLEDRIHSVQKDLCCIQHVDTGAGQ